MKVWILVCVSGEYSDIDWEIEGVFSTKRKAEKYLKYLEEKDEDYSSENDYNIEEHEVE